MKERAWAFKTWLGKRLFFGVGCSMNFWGIEGGLTYLQTTPFKNIAFNLHIGPCWLEIEYCIGPPALGGK